MTRIDTVPEQPEFDLPGIDQGRRSETIEWGRRYMRDCVFARKGDVDPSPSEEHARGNGGAFFTGGPVMFEPVHRIVVTYTGGWRSPHP